MLHLSHLKSAEQGLSVEDAQDHIKIIPSRKNTPTLKETPYLTWFGLNAYVHGRVAVYHYNRKITIEEELTLSSLTHSPVSLAHTERDGLSASGISVS